MSITNDTKKPMVDGMYTRHPMYSIPKVSEEEKHSQQLEQSRRVASKRQARQNGCDILDGLARRR